MSKSGARRAFGLVPVTLELPLSAYHACDALCFRRTRLFPSSIDTILIARTNRFLGLQLRLPREIVEVTVVVDLIERHSRI